MFASRAEDVCRSYRQSVCFDPHTTVQLCFAVLAFDAVGSSLLEGSTAIVTVPIATLRAVFDRSSVEWASLQSAAPSAVAITTTASLGIIDTPCRSGCSSAHLGTYARVSTNGCSGVVTDFEDQ